MNKETKQRTKTSLKINRRRQPTQLRSKIRVERILLAASTLLTKNSVDKLTTRRIAELADVNIATLYQFFPNKEAIIFALYKKWLDETDIVLEQATDNQVKGYSWNIFFGKLFDNLASTHTEVIVKDRLQKAMGMNEELRQLDLDHSIIIAERMAGFMESLGSHLCSKELQQHAMLLFYFERALVTHLQIPMKTQDLRFIAREN